MKPRAECQICERTQAIDADGTLTNHGYKRPGCGWIQGNCVGHGHKPYPETDALEKYVGVLNDHVARCELAIATLPKINERVYRVKVGFGSKRREEVFTVNRGDADRFDFERGRTHVPSFEWLEGVELRNLESEISNAKSELRRIEERIAKAKGMVAA
ncbi:MAG: hypothetical protein ACHP7J_00150 [Terriglobales bacterium]